MRSSARFGLLALMAVPLAAQTTARDRGPNGLEARTDDRHTPKFRTNKVPLGIIIARYGKMIRYIGHKDGGPFFWNLMLLPDGKRIAYESGPFHFSMTCTLMDIATGKHLSDIDCFSDESVRGAPEWVRALQAHQGLAAR